MKSIKEILNNYKDYETFLDDRFGVRFCDFLTEKEAKKIGFRCKEGATWEEPKEWTRENILTQLKEDVLFGMEKMSNQRGISSELMHNVVHSWLKVLEDKELINLLDKYYIDYGKEHFRKVAEKYNIDISEVDY